MSLQRLKTIRGGQCQDLRYPNVFSPESERELLGYMTLVYKIYKIYNTEEGSDKKNVVSTMFTKQNGIKNV